LKIQEELPDSTKKMNNEAYHTSVLLQESVEALNIDPNGTYVDVTFGGGGHSIEILKKLDQGKLVAFDQDADAKENLINDDRFVFIPENFRHIGNFLAFKGIEKVDGILADLGVSGHQFDETARGFSIRGDAALDMRMNQNVGLTAAQFIGKSTEDELVKVFKTNADMPLVYKVARALKNSSPQTTGELIKSVERFAPPGKEHKFFAQVFQAIRIEVNDEMGALRDMLSSTIDILNPSGRLVVISYHSHEDRLVKNFLRSGDFAGEMNKDFFGNLIRPFDPVSNKATPPSGEEIERNNRARSAKMRVGSRNG
jgi:16S rRNA (cytosine1402-N4)-methyltransferase